LIAKLIKSSYLGAGVEDIAPAEGVAGVPAAEVGEEDGEEDGIAAFAGGV
jgi:hypothetical protein